MEKFSVNSRTKFTVLEELNSEFTLAKCYVMGMGKNRNMSAFKKEVVDSKLNTLNYAPVVAHLFQDEEGNYRVGSHDCIFDEDWNMKSICVPFGVVKENTFEYEIVDEFGTNVEYLTCEVILWTGRYPELKEAMYSDDTYFNQSMEINVNQYRPLEEDSNYTEILDFEFSALCLLNKSDDKSENVEPCFISSKVESINFSADDFLQKMSEMKEAIAKAFALENKEEGEQMETEKEITTTEEDTSTEEPVIENESSVEEVETEETTIEEPAVEEIEPETVDYEVKYNEAVEMIAQLTEQINSLNSQVEELAPFKLAVEKAERENGEAEIFAKYDSYIAEMEEYKSLKTNAKNYDLEALDKECIMLVGKFAMQTPIQVKETEDNAPVMKQFSIETKTEKTSRYGDLFERYGNND